MLARKHFILGAVCFLLIVVYGSLVPLHFQPLSFSELIHQFGVVCTTPIKGVSKSDFLANILLFVPLSFLLMGSFTMDFPRRRWFYLVPVVFVCTLLGAGIECLQLMFPPRNSSLSDILAQCIGSFLGALLWSVAGAKILDNVNRVNGRLGSGHRLAQFLPLYLLLMVVLETVPFDFTLSPVEMVHKWREGRICVTPFAAFLDPERHMGTKSFWHVILFLPAGLLIGLKKDLRGFQVLAWGVAIAACIECLQLFVLTRYFEITDILIGGMAIWLGWWMLNLHGTFMAERKQIATTSNMVSLLGVTWLILALAVNWSPFDFTLADAADRLSTISLVPFSDYQQKHYLSAFDDIVHKLLLFVLLGILLSANPARRRSALVVTCLGACVSAVIELGQVLLPSRYPSVTDVLLGAGGSLAGYSLVSSVRMAERIQFPLRVDQHA